MILFILIGSFRFSLGADDCVDNQSDPQQHLEHNQQGKQFDHVNPIIFKSNILFTTCMYAWLILLLNYGLIS